MAELVRRPECDTDEAFCFALFCASRPPGQDLAELDPGLRDRLLRHQYAGQATSYRERYPAGRFDIIEEGRARIGRIVTDFGPRMMTVVDLALIPMARRRDVGRSLMEGVMDEAAAAGVSVRLCVHPANAAR